MRIQFDEIEEMLKLGCCMGPGERYLMLYGGQLAITNRAGLARWPQGRRQMIAILRAADCACGLTLRQWNRIQERLRMLENHPDSCQSDQTGRGPGGRNFAGRMPLLHPT